MSAHTESHWRATYEVRDHHGQLVHQEYTVQVQAPTKMAAMLLAVDKVLDETSASTARCQGCVRL